MLSCYSQSLLVVAVVVLVVVVADVIIESLFDTMVDVSFVLVEREITST